MSLRPLARDLGVALKLGGRALRRRLAGASTTPDTASWRAKLENWLQSLPPGVVADHRFVDLPATRPPWTDTGLNVDAGECVSWFATGRVFLSRALDIWVSPSFQLWARVGTAGPVFRGTRATHTFTAAVPGPLAGSAVDLEADAVGLPPEGHGHALAGNDRRGEPDTDVADPVRVTVAQLLDE